MLIDSSLVPKNEAKGEITAAKDEEAKEAQESCR